jgi:hypothetical protein
MSDKIERRPGENALRDMTTVPVQLLYDEDNDLTVMQRGDASGHTLTNLYGYNGTLWVPVKVDSSTSSLQTVDYAHHEIHSGSHYYNALHVDVPADDVLDIRATMPNTTKWLHWLWTIVTEAEFQLTLYEDCTINTAGTSLTAFNSNRNSTNSSGLTAFDYIVNADLADANVDTTVGTPIFGPVHTGSGRSVGGSASRDSEKVMKQNSTYCMRFENLTNAAKYVSWDFEWYEHTDN